MHEGKLKDRKGTWIREREENREREPNISHVIDVKIFWPKFNILPTQVSIWRGTTCMSDLY